MQPDTTRESLIMLSRRTDDNCFDAKDSVTMTFSERQKCRARIRLDSNLEAALMLPRGTRLCDGDLLLSDCGLTVRVNAAREAVSTAYCDDPLQLARACYHLGNRHLPLQITAAWVRYQHDHVIDQLSQALGLVVSCEQAPFEPENGAYAYGAHGHGSGATHSHEH